MPSDDAWKQKYLQELESAEQRERDWDAEKHILQRLLVRTSLASDGQHPALDQALGELRETLRNGSLEPARLKQLQDAIDQQLVVLDERKLQSTTELKDALARLLTAVREHQLFKAERAGLKRLDRALTNPDTLRHGLAPWLTELAELESRALATDPAAGRRAGILGRLFGTRPQPDSDPVPTSEPEAPVAGDAPVAPLGSVAEAASATESELADLGAAAVAEEADDRLRFARRVGELLDYMLAQVSLQPKAQARARLLRERLGQSADWAELRDAMNDIADLVVAAVSRSQQEFEAFLKRLDDRLAALQLHFSAQTDTLANHQSAIEVLDKSITSGLQELSDEAAATDDMGELKQSVNRHVEVISQAVHVYREKETEREVLLAEQLDAMKEKLAAVEAHSEQMREQLREEHHRALTDALTQLPNREAWQERLEFEYTRWQRYGHPVVLCILDIDHFKRVNDTYGHKAGDRVIQLMSRTLQARLRTTDFAARYGGEEFVMLLPETDLKAAHSVVDGLREQVAKLPFHFQGQRVEITFSAGMALFEKGLEPDAIFGRADKALYEAKDAGRNRIVVAA